MDLNATKASIGYKFHTDCAKDPPCQLSNELEYLVMMEEMVHKTLAAQTQNPVLPLHNLVCPSFFLWRVMCSDSTSMQHPATHTPVSKHKWDDEPTNNIEFHPHPPTTLDFTHEFRELQSRLHCRLHGGCPCHIDPVTAEHNELNIYQLTLWAWMIVCYMLQFYEVTLTIHKYYFR